MSKNTTPTYKWQLVYGNSDKDHSYWVDRNSGRIAIKDESGDYPDETDDCVLWLDTHRPIVIDGSNATIPLVCAAPREWQSHEEGDETCTGTSVVKALRVAHVVGDAEQRGAAPVGARLLQQLAPLFAVQPPEGLVQDDQAHARPEQGAAQAHALPLAARYQPAAFSKLRL